MPKKLDRCVQGVMAQGKTEQEAYAICSDSTGIKRKKGGGWTKGDKPQSESSQSCSKCRDFSGSTFNRLVTIMLERMKS